MTQAPPRFWVVTEDPEHAARWERVLARIGISTTHVTSMRALEADAGAPRRVAEAEGGDAPASASGGLALVDWASVGGSPKAALESLRRTVKGVHLVLFGKGESLCVPGIERVMEAGILELLPVEWDDHVLTEKLRAHVGRLCPKTAASGLIESGGLRVDLRRREVRVRQGRGWRALAALSPKGFELLRLLLENAGRPLGRRVLMERVWGKRSSDVNPEALDKQMGTLRRKLGSQGKRIRTIRGHGYYLTDD